MISFMLIFLLATMLFGIPILLCIALVGFIGIAAIAGPRAAAVRAEDVRRSSNSFTLLALPYFILAGSIMSAGGISQQLVDFARALVGHLRAGLAHAVDRRQHGVVRHLRLVDRGCLGHRLDRRPDHEAVGLQAGLRRRPDRRAPARSARSFRRA